MKELHEVANADPYEIYSVQFSPDGSTIISGGASGTISVGRRWWRETTFLAHLLVI